MSASWVDVSPESEFPLENLPYGAFVRDVGEAARLGVALGDSVIDLHVLARGGLFDGLTHDAGHRGAAPTAGNSTGEPLPEARDVLCATNLNPLLAAGSATWRAVRVRIADLLSSSNSEVADTGLTEAAVVARDAVRATLPFAIGDYVDFYSSLEHATNLGRILRPDGEPLLPNWRWLPIGYHGRAATIVPTDTPIVRPRGQTKAPTATAPAFGPTRMLDFELELGFVTGDGPALGASIPVERAEDVIFGVVLVNDWSARDIQGWEYQPLGPFLGKSFATSLGAWVVPLSALEPYRVAGPRQEPAPLPHLATHGAHGYDITLGATLSSAPMRESGVAAQSIARTNFRDMYWSMAQQLAHASSNGARVRAGDLFASGTISGSEPGSYGSMMELTWRGARPLALADGTQRAFLEDGDELTLHGVAAASRKPRIGLGSVSGIVAPARE